MTIAVLTAVSDPRWEADLAAGLSQDDCGLLVVRRCVDLADLLAAAAAGLAQAVILSSDLRRLDRDALDRLAAAGVAVVGVVATSDEAALLRLHQLGVTELVSPGASSAALARSVGAAVAALAHGSSSEQESPSRGWSDLSPAPTLAPQPAEPPAREDDPSAEPAAGRVVAVWGPVGAPGRTTIAVNLAAELCALGRRVLLIDADTYGGVVAQLLGVLDEAPGLAAACRLANQGSLDVARLAQVVLELRPGLAVLTGIARSDRWPEVRSTALEAVLAVARRLADFVVVDCGFCLEQDEELAYDTAAPRRNGATLVALAEADVVIGVAAADPVGLARYVRAVPECVAMIASTARASDGPSPAPITVVNRLRRGVVGPGDPRRAVAAALGRFAGLNDLHVVPDDGDALDGALAAGRTLSESSPRSPARKAIRELAGRVAAA